MEHHELLQKFNNQIDYSNKIGCECPDCDNAKALYAVVKLHKNHGECGMPMSDGTYPCPATNTCEECGTNIAYPCPTIQAIEKKLG